MAGTRPLLGRMDDLARLQAVVDDARGGRGGALRIEGAPGVGKTALLAALDTTGLRVLRATGTELETGVAFAGLDDLLAGLPGRTPPPAPDADTATVLRDAAARLAAAAPLVVLVDDAQWLDPSSRSAVAFLARRAGRLGVGVVAIWSLRGQEPEPWPDVPVAALAELDRQSALALARDGGVAPPVAEALVAAVGGNALALVQAPADLTPDQRAGRAAVPDPLPVGDRLQRAFEPRLAALPGATQEALLLAAAGAPAAMALPGPGAATRIADALGPAEDAGLVRLGEGVAFVHPLARSAAYHAAAPSRRRAAHAAIATAVPDPLRTWQLALAAPAPDEPLAARLAELGETARRRGAPGSAATMLDRAARLTPDPAVAAGRALAAAAAASVAGRPALAGALLDALLPTVEDPLARADVQLLRGMALHQTGRPREAFALLEAESAAMAARDPLRASALLTQACVALMGPGPMDRLAVLADRARALAPPGADAIPAVIAAEVLVALGEHDRARALLGELEPGLAHWDPTAPGHEVLAVAGLCRLWLGDHDVADATLRRLVDANRAAGAAGPLAPPLAVLATLHIRRGELDRAAAAADEALEIAETGLGGGFVLTLALAAVAMTAAHRGEAATTRAATDRMLVLGAELELTSTLACAEQALGQLHFGRGEADVAAAHFARALEHTRAHGTRDPAFLFTHADLVEALVRSGRAAEAAPVLADLEAGAERTGGAWARAAVLRCRGLLGPREAVEDHLAAALEAHAALPMPFEVARTRLALGERLRRDRRPSAARAALGEAHAAFAGMGARTWAARAARELEAAGGATGGGDAGGLTARERAVCDLVAAGATNREVAAALFLSPRTVEHHLRAIYRKLGVRSRSELAARRASAS